MSLKKSVSSVPFFMSCILGSTETAFAHSEPLQVDMPAVALANSYHETVALDKYWVSEKLDGIRAIWTGNKLVTRTGKRINAPSWFTALLPDFPVEGELWAGRGAFSQVQKTVLDSQPDEHEWKKIRFMLFDLPGNRELFPQRYSQLKSYIAGVKSDVIGLVRQNEIEDEKALFSLLQSIEKQGGEGVMLRDITASYTDGRNDYLLKLKSVEDMEVTVIGYKRGKGKYEGMTGALKVQLLNGKQMYVGSGLNDKDRVEPPELGAVITIQFSGYTSGGLPRFARYHRIRQPE